MTGGESQLARPECHWWKSISWRPRGEEEQELSQSDLDLSLSIIIYCDTFSNIPLHWIYRECIVCITSSLSLSQSSISAEKIVMTRGSAGLTICLLKTEDHPQSNILKPSLMWGAIIEKKGKKEENLAAILPHVNPCANIIEAHNRIFLPKLTARVWNLSKYVLTFSPDRPTGPNWWPLAFQSNHFAEVNCWRWWRWRFWRWR